MGYDGKYEFERRRFGKNAEHLEPLAEWRPESLAERSPYQVVLFCHRPLGVSSRRMLLALADRETDPAALAAPADKRLRGTPAQLCPALGACIELNPAFVGSSTCRCMNCNFLEQQMGQLDQEIANLLRPHEDAVNWPRCRICEWIRSSRSGHVGSSDDQQFHGRS